MKRVMRMHRPGKVTAVTPEVLATRPAARDVDRTVALIHALIPLGLQAVAEALDAEVTALAGARDRRMGGQPGLVRWRRQQGSGSLADQKLPITSTRGRDRPRRQDGPRQTDERVRAPRAADAGRFGTVLRGLSGRAEAAGATFVARIVDGNTFADDTIGIAWGITTTGEKNIRGVVQTATEHESVWAAFFRSLVERRRRPDDGLRWVIDGAKGLRKAMQTVFGQHAGVQRCQWHKREKVVRSLPNAQQATGRRRRQYA